MPADEVDELLDLIERANMDVMAHSTGVLQSVDNSLRVQACRRGWPAEYGDCIAIGFMNEATPGTWHFGMFSPARARLLARHLIKHAEALEKANGTKPIDEPVRALCR